MMKNFEKIEGSVEFKLKKSELLEKVERVPEEVSLICIVDDGLDEELGGENYKKELLSSIFSDSDSDKIKFFSKSKSIIKEVKDILNKFAKNLEKDALSEESVEELKKISEKISSMVIFMDGILIEKKQGIEQTIEGVEVIENIKKLIDEFNTEFKKKFNITSFLVPYPVFIAFTGDSEQIKKMLEHVLMIVPKFKLDKDEVIENIREFLKDPRSFMKSRTILKDNYYNPCF